ncbi:MAG: Polyhydroxyalkanoic acid synthase [Candidatus Binatus sp.]|nr:Polyhydroxyalkanoic acid synthase [Candidatus Binatus sp.]
MSTSANAGSSAAESSIGARVREEVQRTIQRSIKGLNYFLSDDLTLGVTPKDTIHKRGTLSLHHYRPLTDEIYRVPIVLVMSLVSKYYILDLAPGQSFIEFLAKQGYDVYLIDWGVPRPEDSHLKLEDYVLDFMPDCIAKIREDSGEPDISMIGYCMGGMLALMYAALHPKGSLKNLVCLTTPVNFEGMGLMRQWTDPRYFDVDKIVNALGNVPPELISASFDMLRPAAKIASQIRLWDNMWNDEFVKSYRMFDRWAADQIPFPGECFRQTTKELMWDNKLIKNQLVLGGRHVDLTQIKMSFLAVMAEHDHIVPYESAKELIALIGSTDKRDIILKGGHVSLVAGPNAVRRLWPALDGWLSERSI